jgi:hypothetical protein
MERSSYAKYDSAEYLNHILFNLIFKHYLTIGLVHKLPLFGQNTEFMDRFMLCAENHTATTLGLGLF